MKQASQRAFPRCGDAAKIGLSAIGVARFRSAVDARRNDRLPKSPAHPTDPERSLRLPAKLPVRYPGIPRVRCSKLPFVTSRTRPQAAAGDPLGIFIA